MPTFRRKSETTPIQFRLDSPWEELFAAAARTTGHGRNETAKRLLQDALTLLDAGSTQVPTYVTKIRQMRAANIALGDDSADGGELGAPDGAPVSAAELPGQAGADGNHLLPGDLTRPLPPASGRKRKTAVSPLR